MHQNAPNGSICFIIFLGVPPARYFQFFSSQPTLMPDLVLVNDGWGISYEIALRWMPLDLTDDKLTLVQVMAWCRQATSYYLSKCWPRFVSPNGVTKPQYTCTVHKVLTHWCSTGSIQLLLMPWFLAPPGHQQPWFWLYWINRSLSSTWHDVNYLCHLNVEKLWKIQLCFCVS